MTTWSSKLTQYLKACLLVYSYLQLDQAQLLLRDENSQIQSDPSWRFWSGEDHTLQEAQAESQGLPCPAAGREKTQLLGQFGYNTLHLGVQTGGVIENTGEC